MKKIKKYTEEYLKYSIGYTQIALSIDSPTFWIIIELIAQIQRIAMVFLFEEVLELLQNRRQIGQPWNSDYKVIKLVSKIFVPTIFMADMLSNNSIIALQIILTIFLMSPLLAIAAFIQFEKSFFATIQFKSQVGGQENQTLSINLLNRSYNMSDFIENFLYQQLMGNDQRSWLNSMRTIIAKLLNTYPHICTIPLMYWNLLLILFVIYDENMSSDQRVLIMVFDIFTTGFMIILWMFSMIAQRSYSMFDNNHLRIIQSAWFNISQIVKFLPIVVQFVYFLSQDPNYNLGIQNAITTIIQINILGDLIDFFYSIPYMYEYKQNVSFLCLTSSLIISITHEFQLKQMELFSICLISIPLTTKLIKQMFCFLLEILFDKQFFKEKQKKKVIKQQVQRKSRILEEELSPFVIEKEMQELKQQQIEVLKNQHFRYFIHYLRYSSFLRLQDQQSFDQNSNIDLKKSQFLINLIILIKSHVDNCESVYCYCKGFRGEKRRVVNCEQKQIDMKIYTPITINNIYIQVELIERYIRHYTKYVFDIENNEQNPNIFRLSQLLLYLCDSEECYQVMTLIQDYKIKNQKNHNLINEVALTLVVGLAKFKVLQKMKSNMVQSDIETAIKYKNYRITEIRRDQIINHIFKNIDSKYKFLKTLSEGKLNFTQFYRQVENQVLRQQIMIDEIETFYKYSACRTSILISMFYTLEVSYNFEKFAKLNNTLKTKSYKFFEYPTTSVNMIQLQGYKVLYLKTNLARHFINGQFFRGQIMDFSNNAPFMLGYEPREFKEHILTVHQLVTPNLAHFHDQLLEIVFLTNKPAVLRKRRPLLMQRKGKELIFCEMFLDLSFNITQDAFPIYCFLKQIVPYGKYENVKGHIIISDKFIIEGISTQCLEQLKIKVTQYNQRNIEELTPKFQNYVKLLQDKYQQFLNEESQRKREKSTHDKFDFQSFEQLLVHFQIEEEHIVLTVQQEKSAIQDIYFANGLITMSIGNIHSKLYQAYLISFNKVTLAENQSSSQAFDLMRPTTSFTSMNPLRFDSIQGIVQVDSESGNVSDNSERKVDEQIDILEYQIPQLYSNFQTPLDSSRMMLSNHIQQNEENCLKSFENQEHYKICVEDVPQSSSHFHNLTWKKKQQNGNKRISLQQDYFHEDQTKKQRLSEIEIQNNGTENDLWKKQNEPSLHPSQNNSTNISILQKSQLYSKFSRIKNTPKLIRIILGLATVNILIMLTIASVSLSKYNKYLDTNQEILFVFLPFTTINLLRNSYLGLSLYCDKQNITYLEEVIDAITNNLHSHEKSLQTIFLKQIVSHAVSHNKVEIYEFYSKQMVNVSTWTEIFQMEMFLQRFERFDSDDETSLEKVQEAIFVLLNSFFNFIDVYESTTTYFHETMINNLDQNTLQQSYVSFFVDLIEILILIFYIISWICLLRLQKKILRSSEQIQMVAVQNERVRFSNFLQQFKAASELNLYKYQFSLKNKIQPDKFSNKNFLSFKVSQTQKAEQTRQLQIQDDNKFGLSNFILFYPIIGIIIFCSYIQFICLENYSQGSILQEKQKLFNLYIYYCQEITELTFVHYVVQNSEYLEEIGIEDELIEEYKAQVEEAYGEFQEFDQQFKYGNADQSTDILNKSVENICLVVSDSLCTTVAEGRLTQGLLYSIQYYMDIIRDNLNNEFDEATFRKMYRDDLLAVNFIIDSLEQIIDLTLQTIWEKMEQLQQDAFKLYINFIILICFLYILELLVVYKYVKVRFYRCRQLPYLLPPQSTYGEDSFQKSLQYIEKIYHNIIQ